MEQTLNNESWKVTDHILKYLEEHPNSSIKEMAEKLGKTQGNISTTIDKMLKGKYVKRVSFGHYSSTYNKTINVISQDGKGNVTSVKPMSDIVTAFDLDIANLLILKKKYGKDELIKKLREAIKILE